MISTPVESTYQNVKKQTTPVVWVASNCQSSNGREAYVKELMKYIDVDSYGGCLNNKPFPESENLSFCSLQNEVSLIG